MKNYFEYQKTFYKKVYFINVVVKFTVLPDNFKKYLPFAKLLLIGKGYINREESGCSINFLFISNPSKEYSSRLY